jgi:thiol:disulfide interchange protein DsbC
MKKTILLSLAVASLATSSFANFLPKTELDSFNNLELLKKVGANVTSVYDANSLYIANIDVRENQDMIYITKDKKYLISGNVVNMENGNILTAPIENLAILKNKESFTYGTGKSEYYLFTDPECPYCKELEKYFPKIKDKVKINIFHFPLITLHPDAKELSKYQMSLYENTKDILEILSKTTKSEDYIARKYSKETEDALEKKINEQMQIASTLKITGTPAIIKSNGEQMNWVSFLKENGIDITQPGN